MPQEFRYPLTRYCLRGGALTLPRTMVGLFPESGEIVALDTRSETEHTLTVLDPRTITGLGTMFKQHRLAVNDELLIRPLEDGRFSFTPVKREHKPDYSSPEALDQVLDELIAASVPVTEAEVRALYPGIPEDLALSDVFEADDRFERREGRWHNGLSLTYPLEPAPANARSQAAGSSPKNSAPDREDGIGDESDERDENDERTLAAVGSPKSTVSAAKSARNEAGSEAGNDAGFDAATAAGKAGGEARGGKAGTDARQPGDAPGGAEAGGDAGTMTGLHGAVNPHSGSLPHVQAGLWQQDFGDAQAAMPASAPDQVDHGRSQGTVLERRRPLTPSGRSELEQSGFDARPGSHEEDDELEDVDGGASLEVTELSNRLRAVLAPVGFRLEPVARGQLLLTADMGRKGYTVLAQLLTRNDRLDWADLLARRRATNVRYLAVIGDQRALLRLINPAELARATMWSWQALDRLATLQRAVSFSPVELESHFERDGLFERGLERFEAAVAGRVAERGAVSELLTRLAEMRAPAVFLLEDLAGELKVPRDRLLRQLEMLAEAPFHLIARVDKGEFVLRQRVSDSLDNLASYATSLRQRLPTKHVERLTGLAEPDLLTDSELGDQTTNGSRPGSAT